MKYIDFCFLTHERGHDVSPFLRLMGFSAPGDMEETGSERTPCVHGSTAHSSRTWKPPKCPPTGEWIKKMWDIYTGQYYSAVRKNEIMPYAAMWMDLEIVILNNISQTGKQKHLLTALICGIQKAVIQVLLLTKQKETHRLRE